MVVCEQRIFLASNCKNKWSSIWEGREKEWSFHYPYHSLHTKAIKIWSLRENSTSLVDQPSISKHAMKQATTRRRKQEIATSVWRIHPSISSALQDSEVFVFDLSYSKYFSLLSSTSYLSSLPLFSCYPTWVTNFLWVELIKPSF